MEGHGYYESDGKKYNYLKQALFNFNRKIKTTTQQRHKTHDPKSLQNRPNILQIENELSLQRAWFVDRGRGVRKEKEREVKKKKKKVKYMISWSD